MVKLVLTLFAVCGLAHAEGETRFMTPDQAEQFGTRLRGWANAYYPALVAEKKLPEGIVLGFIIDKSGAVIDHTVGLEAPVDGTAVVHHLAQLFPRYKESQLLMAGAGCFGSRPGEPRYCVEYATLAR